ncbi:uncharacterized protein LOC123529392 isoform X2 [Mercenaria mercenaria]|uniref:uncharacterized protein LOC123529392 isoform X2 n=1 Tax=Mercenaria mercenaria TaxID=6596 RepID=UPI00234E5B93|nr:uncharacterized protein LOC123529392 isoform X2 [Mercenaria mercenaria]
MRRTLIALLLTLASAHCLVDGQLYIDNSCKWSYQIKDLYNVTVQDLGSVCPQSSIMPPSGHILDQTDMYRLKINQINNGRTAEIDWEHDSCFQEYYMQFEANFQPYWRLDNTRRKCIRFIVTRLSTKWAYDRGSRLYFNCLRINSREMGTLAIKNSKHNVDMTCPERSSSDSIKFDLGCGFDKTRVEIDNCLSVEFRGLHSDTDFRRTKIEYKGIKNCTHTYDGTHIYCFSDPGHLNLPVYGDGIYSIDIILVCNASGEVAYKTFHFEENVTKASSCSIYNSSVRSTCGVLETTTQSKEVSTVWSSSPQNQLYTLITVVSAIGTVVIIVTVVFIHQNRRTKRNQQGRDTEESQINTGGHEMQMLCGNELNGITKVNTCETTNLQTEENNDVKETIL